MIRNSNIKKDRRLTRLEELDRFFISYSMGEINEDDSVVDALADEYAALHQEVYANR